jgi:NAD(P)-dependent dehydrogenase (short-subunit alcohol dehydrogenase family)
MSAPLAGTVALITGGGSGIGAAAATRLAADGADVVIFDIDESAMTATVASIAAAGGRARSRRVDVSDLDALAPALESVAAEVGEIGVLVSCAGITGQPAATSFFETGTATWDAVFRVNAQAPFVLMQLVGRRMIAAGIAGRIVNITSSGAFRARALPAYSASKAALGQLTRVAAAELAPHGITVNNVAPGLTATKIVADIHPDLEGAVRQGPLANLTERVSEPEDVAAAIAFLCLPEARQIVAQTIHTSAGAVV